MGLAVSASSVSWLTRNRSSSLRTRHSGLAETLRSELLLYGISVQAYFPASILSPGFEQENRTKPKVTLEIEEGDSPLTPEQCAKGLVKGECSAFITPLQTVQVSHGKRKLRGRASSE